MQILFRSGVHTNLNHARMHSQCVPLCLKPMRSKRPSLNLPGGSVLKLPSNRPTQGPEPSRTFQSACRIARPWPESWPSAPPRPAELLSKGRSASGTQGSRGAKFNLFKPFMPNVYIYIQYIIYIYIYTIHIMCVCVLKIAALIF